MLDDGSLLQADLFVDCTGPAAHVRSALGGGFDDWNRWLLCDRLTFDEGVSETEAPLVDRVTAFPAGWSWAASSPVHSSRGVAFSSAHCSDAEAASNLGADGSTITMRQGRWSTP